VQAGQGKTFLAMTHGGTWQGHTIEVLDLYDVSNGKVRKLTKAHINLHSDNGGWCMPEKYCWDVSGEWKLETSGGKSAYPDLVITFSGEEMDPVEGATEETSPDVERALKPIKAAARYRFDGTEYKLIEGENPVPSI
jgi:hypothetical protein